jgi:hypothetical protein
MSTIGNLDAFMKCWSWKRNFGCPSSIDSGDLPYSLAAYTGVEMTRVIATLLNGKTTLTLEALSNKVAYMKEKSPSARGGIDLTNPFVC